MDPRRARGVLTALLVEDHASYREALRTLLETDGGFAVVEQVGTAEEAGPAAARTHPDLALVDLDLAGGSGVRALADIRTKSPGTVCVILTAIRDEAAFGQAVEAGAAGVLHKSVGAPELLKTLRDVAADGTQHADTSGWLRAWDRERERGRYARLLAERITPREREVLACLAQGASNGQMARDLGIAPDTVQTHVGNLLAKMAATSRLEAVVKALRLGLVDPPG